MQKWIHAPLHLFNEKGTYMVTGATLHKAHYFNMSDDLDEVQNLLIKLTEHYQWKLEAWALFSNHYHFIAHSPNDPTTLKKMITHFHASSAIHLNQVRQTAGRKVWYQYWDTHLTFHNSYLARLNYVMQNPVKHKLVEHANDYKWCSASWFEKFAAKTHYETVMSIKTDKVNILDDF